MQVLRFSVKGADITPEPIRTPAVLYPGMTEPVRLEFTFSPEWKGTTKVAAFWSILGNEYPPKVLKDGKSCIVPFEALQRAAFKVQIMAKQNGEIHSTGKCTVYLKGGKT